MVVIGSSTKDCPAGMVAVAGSVASVIIEEERFTTNGCAVEVLRVMRNVPASVCPSTSVNEDADKVSAGPSLSVMVRLAETEPAVFGSALQPQELT